MPLFLKIQIIVPVARVIVPVVRVIYSVADFVVPVVSDIIRFRCVDVALCQLNVSHVWKIGLRVMFGVGVRAKRVCGIGAVDSQHGAGVERSSLPGTKGHHPKYSKAFYFYFITTHVLIIHSICYKYIFCAIHILLLYGIKINHVTEIRNKPLFLGCLQSPVAESLFLLPIYVL